MSVLKIIILVIVSYYIANFIRLHINKNKDKPYYRIIYPFLKSNAEIMLVIIILVLILNIY